MKIIVSPRRSVRSTRRFRICAWIDTSRALTASSAIRSSGCGARLRAIATRCRCPPLSSRGKRRASAGVRPTRSSNSATLAGASSRLAIPCTRNGSAMAAPTVSRGLSEVNGSWKTTWIRRRISCRSFTPREATSVPSKTIEPASGSTRRVRQRASVVLPLPDSPTMPSVRFRRSDSETPSTAVSRGAGSRLNLLESERRNSNCFTRSVTCSSGISGVKRAPR